MKVTIKAIDRSGNDFSDKLQDAFLEESIKAKCIESSIAIKSNNPVSIIIEASVQYAAGKLIFDPMWNAAKSA